VSTLTSYTQLNVSTLNFNFSFEIGSKWNEEDPIIGRDVEGCVFS
jgi:hypothetical protein